MTDLEQQHFTGTVWRPPYEAHSVLLQATVGCTHRACKFCTLYGDLRFRLSSAEEIEADLRLIARHQPRARRVFLVGANPFVLSYGRLVRLVDRIRDHLPKVRTVGMFARITDIAAKSDEELRDLRARGVTGLSIGTETGDEATLEFMNKGWTASDALEQCRRLDEAGIEYYLTYMTGLAGAGNGRRAAEATAALFNRLHPYIIGIVSLTLFPEAPLAVDVAAGRFEEATERERIEELRAFLAGLTLPATIMGHTVSNTVPLLGRLPEDRARMLRELDAALDRLSEEELLLYRRGIEHL
ncbi:MAG: radical SAM protein [Alistipes sp.]|nr:radical SAM protein [Alistipes senegalensis]MCM1250970.1 radical SAM protein [Alistipes sp.]